MPSIASVIFDLIMVGLIVAAVFIGKKMGLLRMVFVLGIVFFASIIARFAMPLVSTGLMQLKVGDSVKNSVESTITEWIEEDANLDFDGVVEKLGLPKEIAAEAEKTIDGIKEEKGKELAGKVAQFISDATVRLASYIIVAIVVIILLVLISLLTKLVQKIPVVGTINSAGGIVVGVIAALITIFLVCLFVSSIGLGSTGVLSDITQRSYIIKFLGWTGVIGGIIK